MPVDDIPQDGVAADGVADPGRISTRQEFAAELSLLKDRAGLTVRDIAGTTGIPASTLGGYFGGSHLPPVKMSDLLPRILSACGVNDAAETECWLAALARVRRAPGRRPADAVVPYRGLKSFQPEDAEWFFGRRRLTGILVGQLRGSRVSRGPLAVVGASGSGKSSLLRAGLIPAVRRGALGTAGCADWPVLLFTPGAHPAAELTRRLAAVTVGAGDQGQARALIVVDQFEEVFTACRDENERRAFIAALCAESAALVVVGLRADFYSHALRYPELVSALESRQVLVGPMSEEELRSAITEPARKAGLDIETGLVEVLLRELAPAADQREPPAAHEPGALPLLSHALLATWDLSRGGRLTLADYRASGGIQGAVAASAEEVYAGLTPARQDLARRLFTRLVRVADDTADTRRRVPTSELLLLDGDVQPVLDAFIEQRLITAGSDTVELAHETLLHAWPRLRQWIDSGSISARAHRQLTAAAQTWRDAGRDPGALYSGGRLASAEEWAALPAHADDLNRLEREFLDASVGHRLQAERAARRQAKRLRGFTGALAALLVVAGSLAAIAYQQRNAATRQRDLAISREVAIEANQLRGTDIALAMQLSLAAYQISPTTEAASSLLNATATPAATRMPGPGGTEMNAVAFDPGGSVLAAGNGNGSVRLWSVRGRPAPLSPPFGTPGTLTSVAFSPDGTVLSIGDAGGQVSLWNVSDPRRPALLGRLSTGSAAAVNAVAYSPDGLILAAGDASGRVYLWDAAGPRRGESLTAPLDAGTSAVNAVAFGPDGRTLAAGTASGRIELWAVPRAGSLFKPVASVNGPANGVNTLAFSPDGLTLAAAGNDNKVWLWTTRLDWRTAAEHPPLSGAASWIYSLAFSPGGQSIAAGSADNNAYIWNMASGALVTTLPHPAPVLSVAYGAGGGTLATGDADDVARIWTLPGPVLAGASGSVFTVAFSPDGGTIAAGSQDGTTRLWLATPALAAQYVCAIAGEPITASEWAQYIPGLPYNPPCTAH